MGIVYEALQAQPHRRVALKLIRTDKISDDLLRRFSVEIHALGRLRHPGIARIYEGGAIVGDGGTKPYFVMELVSGLPLDEYVRTHRVGLRECVMLMIHVAEAVHHAHQQDVIHRDLKPANIFVDDSGQPKILDFGVARVIGAELLPSAAAHTQSGVVVGTLPYMSPEQSDGDSDEFDQRSDVYALGVITYKLLAGQLPYTLGGGLLEARHIIHESKPRMLGTFDKRLKGDLEFVVDKALAKKRAQRYQTAKAFADDLRCVLEGRISSIDTGQLTRTLRRLSMREGNFRQIGWAGVLVYGALSFFFAMYVTVGTSVWLRWSPEYVWWPLSPQDPRYSEAMRHMIGWMALLAALAWVHWKVRHKRVPFMWVALGSGVALTIFTTAVLFGFYYYDCGGMVRDPVIRVALYMLYAPLAVLAVMVAIVALVSAYQIQRWEMPVLAN